jgi:hypothetical protein
MAPLPDGNVLLAGGDAGAGATDLAEPYLTGTQRFCPLPICGAATMTTNRGYDTATPLPNGEVLIAGGFNGSQALATAELYVTAPEATVTGGDFGDQTVGQPSAEQSLVITNLGAQALVFSGPFQISGSAAGDFATTANACAGRRLAFEQSCTIALRFTPSVAGARSAAIGLPDNEPGAAHGVPLDGVGVTADSGPAGPAGSPGQIELVSCQIISRRVTRHGRTDTVKRRKCTTKRITGTATFTATEARATLSRGRLVYAIGTAYLSTLTLHQLHPIRAGRYTLTLISGTGPRAARTSRAITISRP